MNENNVIKTLLKHWRSVDLVAGDFSTMERHIVVARKVARSNPRFTRLSETIADIQTAISAMRAY